jgi:hypothetical protein
VTVIEAVLPSQGRDKSLTYCSAACRLTPRCGHSP